MSTLRSVTFAGRQLARSACSAHPASPTCGLVAGGAPRQCTAINRQQRASFAVTFASRRTFVAASHPSPHASQTFQRRMRLRCEQKRSMFIQTQETPNSDAIKFLPNVQILPEQLSNPYLEYLTPRSTLQPPYPSPLAAQLLNVDGVTSVFYGTDSITVTKTGDANWAHIKPEVFSLITEAVTAGSPIVNVVEGQSADGQEGADTDSLKYDQADSEVVSMIKELLETRVRPTIQEDGGDIEFRGFENGNVMLKLRGACRTCDSSTVTLKNGIENMLMHYIDEVKSVTQVLDPEEEVSMAEFAKFEEKLRQQKGSHAAASTVGKGSLDFAE